MHLRLLSSAILLAASTAATFAQTTYPSGVTGCIARWNFASVTALDTLPDVSGNGHNGISYSLVNTRNFRNVPNTAMTFNGYSSFVQIPSNTQLSPSAITIVAVARFDSFYNGLCMANRIYCKGFPDAIAGDYEFGISSNNYTGDCAIYDTAHQQLAPSFGTLSYTTPAANFVHGHKWYFLASSYDGGDTLKVYQVPMDTLYYDSTVAPLVSIPVTPTPIGSNSIDATIGKHLNPSYPYWFGGAMDELVLFNKVLTKAEMQSVYNYLWGYPTTASANVINEQNVIISPNPNRGVFTIEGNTGNTENVHIEMKNMLGQTIYMQDLRVTSKINHQVSLSGSVPNGIYILSVTSGTKQITQRIMINR